MNSPAPRILVTTSSFGMESNPAIARMRANGLEVESNPFGRRLTADELVQLGDERVVGVIAGVEPWSRGALDAFPGLRVISRCGTGMENVDSKEADRRDIRVVNTPDAPAAAVAELTLALILGLLRSVPTLDRAVRAGEWPRFGGELLEGKTVGILGVGRIGRRVSKLVQGFGAQVVAFDPAPAAVPEGVSLLSLEELVAASQIVTLHCPPLGNAPLVDSEFLSRLRPGSFLVNTARGSLIDEGALYRSLETGHLAGAALDVFLEEPYRGPLTSLENVIVTPHIASSAKETRARMENEAASNLLDVLLDIGVATE